MNTTTQERERGERIAQILMKALALIGLVALLTFIAWGTLKLGGMLPAVRGTLTGGVVSVESIFNGAQQETITFTLDQKAFFVNREIILPFTHANPSDGVLGYDFSYDCRPGVSFEVKSQGVWNKVPCGISFELPSTTDALVLISSSNETRYVDVPLTITTRGSERPVSDRTVVTIENTAVAVSRDVLFGTTTRNDMTNVEPDVEGTPVASAPKMPSAASPTPKSPTQPLPVASFPPRPKVVGPQDLSVSITGTGVLLSPPKTSSFVTRSTIPNTAAAAVRFTVSNVGGTASGPWGFVANLPIEGDADYKYTSPLQASLNPGDRIEFTLSFDEVRKAKNGAITITLVPSAMADNKNNNRSTKIITIGDK